MGVWGPNLYQNDIAIDVRDYYKDQLTKGKSDYVIIQELIKLNENILSDCDEVPVFWFALADIQWSLGRLDDFVKKQALFHIQNKHDLKHWELENPAQAKIRIKVLSDLEQKLLSPQPDKKKIVQRKLYNCDWKIGDVFAYKMESDLAKEKGIYGHYLLIHKIDNDYVFPGHKIPVVYIKITNSNNLSNCINEYEQLDYIQIGFTRYEDRFLPIDGKRPEEDIAEKAKLKYEVDKYGFLPQFRLKLLSTSKRIIPKKLIFIDNILTFTPPPKEFIPHNKLSIPASSWRNFESMAIDRYFGNNLHKYQIYASTIK